MSNFHYLSARGNQWRAYIPRKGVNPDTILENDYPIGGHADLYFGHIWVLKRRKAIILGYHNK